MLYEENGSWKMAWMFFPIFLLLCLATDVALLALEIHLAFGLADQAEQHLGECCFAATRFANDGDHLAFIQREIDVIDGHRAMAAKTKDLSQARCAEANGILNLIGHVAVAPERR